MPWHKIYNGDTLKVLKTLPNESVDCIITSPPYWGLRDYGEETNTIWDGDPNCEHEFEVVETRRPNASGGKTNFAKEKFNIKGKENFKEFVNYHNRVTKSSFCKKCGAWYGQLGLEPTLEMYIKHMLQITAELKRVLKKTGVMLWNHGDCYGGTGTGHKPEHYPEGHKLRFKGTTPSSWYADLQKVGVKPKCMALQNYRLVLRMIDEQGWILRNIIIWHKPNHMPSSVKDRFTSAYEPVFMLVKTNKPSYYYNIKTGLMVNKKPKELKEGVDYGFEEVGIVNENTFNVRVRDANKDRFLEKATEEEIRNYGKPKTKKVSYWKSIDYWFDLDAVRVPHKESTIERCKYPYKAKYDMGDFRNVGASRKSGGINDYNAQKGKVELNPFGKNPGDLWTIPTQPFSEAHFATFPEQLVEPMIKAGCPRWICKKCGKARVRLTKTEYNINDPLPLSTCKVAPETRFDSMKFRHGYSNHYTLGWTDCGCNAGWEAGIVLDPFAGSGTTNIVAEKLGRNSIGIELNPEYVKLIEKRFEPYLKQAKLFGETKLEIIKCI